METSWLLLELACVFDLNTVYLPTYLPTYEMGQILVASNGTPSVEVFFWTF